MRETKNAIIRNVWFGTEAHGILTLYLTLDYGGICQGFGGYGLYSKNWKERPNFCGHFIRRVLEVVGVEKWHDLQGKTVRAIVEHEKVHAIGNIIADDWFNPSEDFKDLP